MSTLSVFHLHPLQRCNLRCLHCYSDSSPQASALLPLDDARTAVALAARWGYRALAISGGEPMLYPGLPDLLRCAAGAGMQTSLVTNGLLCRTRRDAEALRAADTVTVSLDGLAARHDQMRGRSGAYQGAADAVRRLADAGGTVWVACGVTAANLDDVEELAANAACWGAHGITFHQVEPAGRAAALPPALFLTPQQRLVLYAAGALLAAARRHTIEIRVDLLHRDTILRHPALIHAAPDAHGAANAALPSQAIRVLAMTPDGLLVPVCHGFNPRYAVGRLASGVDPQHMWELFFERVYPALTALAQASLDLLRSDDRYQVVNPGDWLAERSYARSAPRREVAPRQAAGPG